MSAPAPIRLAIVGLGKIARDQHLRALRGDPRFVLAATADPQSRIDETPAFASLDALLADGPAIDAVSVCTPPQARHALARRALAAGKHVMLEKPPAATLGEVDDLRAQAGSAAVSLFAAWHSRCAPGVAPAQAWLAGRRPIAVRVTWKEDVRVWHPGQDWIFEPGGLGVFDPAINALSILTALLPGPLRLTRAELRFPAGRQAPIAAELALHDAAGAPIAAELDFLQTGPQSWDIEIETDGGLLALSKGGAEMRVDGTLQPLPPEGEYAALYARFAELVATGASDVDAEPLRLVADALLVGRRHEAAAFSWN